MTGEPRWISIKICAREILGVHPLTAYKWFYAGKLPGARIGRTIRIDLKALNSALEKKAQVR